MSHPVIYLDAQILHELGLEIDDVQRESVGGQLGGVEAASELLLLEDCHVAVAEPGQERRTGDGGGAAAEQGHPLPEQVYKNICDHLLGLAA